MRIWKLISHHEQPAEAFRLFCDAGVIAIGWTDVGDLRKRQPPSARAITEWIQVAYPHLKNSHLGGPSLWSFFSSMAEGDLVLVASQGKRYGVLRVAGEYVFSSEAEAPLGYRHTRRAFRTDLDAEEIWSFCDGKMADGHNSMWTLALLEAPAHLNFPTTEQLRPSSASAAGSLYWLNVDLPNRTQMLHIDAACGDVRRRGTFGVKQVGQLSRVGGWLSFASIQAAQSNADTRISQGLQPLAFCSNCRKVHPQFALEPSSLEGSSAPKENHSPQTDPPQATRPAADPLEDPTLLDLLKSTALTDTEKDAIVKLRVGQGYFRDQLLEWWGGCSVTGCKHDAVLIASHIVPWRLCRTGADRLNPANGLLLTPNLDKLFDRGYISFDERGRILISSKVSVDMERTLGIDPGLRLRNVGTQVIQPFLARHREEIFQIPAKPRPGEGLNRG